MSNNDNDNDLTLSVTVSVRESVLNPVEGVMTRFDREACVVLLDQEPTDDLVLGAQVRIGLCGAEDAKIAGEICQRVGRRLTVTLLHCRAGREHRYFPRVETGLSIAYRLIDDISLVPDRGGLRGIGPADQAPWHCPPPRVNVSASGIRFEDDLGCAIGDHILLAIELPGRPGVIRATARVVREDQDPEGVREIAVEYVEILPTDIEALTDYTLDQQLLSMTAPPWLRLLSKGP